MEPPKGVHANLKLNSLETHFISSFATKTSKQLNAFTYMGPEHCVQTWTEGREHR